MNDRRAEAARLMHDVVQRRAYRVGHVTYPLGRDSFSSDETKPRQRRASVGVSSRTQQRRRQVSGIDGRCRPLTDEHRAQLRAAHAARHAREGGRHQTAETRAKISQARRAQPRRMAECHPDRPHWGRGQCSTCYHREYARNRRRQ